ncbi:integrase core domain-containing protein [Enterobacter roggenkampii]|uniref:integrase core domain-containing protein n=1 Tax=Enterobacter roggenkampii TaxID=1812935 RepID=UPI00351E0ADB
MDDVSSSIQPSKTSQNEFIKIFNVRLRDEHLNGHWFSDIYHVRKIIRGIQTTILNADLTPHCCPLSRRSRWILR